MSTDCSGIYHERVSKDCLIHQEPLVPTAPDNIWFCTFCSRLVCVIYVEKERVVIGATISIRLNLIIGCLHLEVACRPRCFILAEVSTMRSTQNVIGYTFQRQFGFKIHISKNVRAPSCTYLRGCTRRYQTGHLAGGTTDHPHPYQTSAGTYL